MEIIDMMREIFEFIRQKKMYWLVPLVVALLFFVILVMVAEASSTSAFVYPTV